MRLALGFRLWFSFSSSRNDTTFVSYQRDGTGTPIWARNLKSNFPLWVTHIAGQRRSASATGPGSTLGESGWDSGQYCDHRSPPAVRNATLRPRITSPQNGRRPVVSVSTATVSSGRSVARWWSRSTGASSSTEMGDSARRPWLAGLSSSRPRGMCPRLRGRDQLGGTSSERPDAAHLQPVAVLGDRDPALPAAGLREAERLQRQAERLGSQAGLHPADNGVVPHPLPARQLERPDHHAVPSSRGLPHGGDAQGDVLAGGSLGLAERPLLHGTRRPRPRTPTRRSSRS